MIIIELKIFVIYLWVFMFLILKNIFQLGLVACKNNIENEEDKFLILQRHFLNLTIKLSFGNAFTNNDEILRFKNFKFYCFKKYILKLSKDIFHNLMKMNKL